MFKRIVSACSAVALVAFLAVQADAELRPTSYSGYQGSAHTDSANWKANNTINGTTPRVDTLSSAEIDTTLGIEYAGAQSVLIAVRSDTQTAASTNQISVQAQVSLDNSTWTDIGPTFSLASSGDATGSILLLAPSISDTSATVGGVAGFSIATKAHQDIVAASRYARVRTLNNLTSAGDTLRLSIVVNKVYPPR